MKKTLIALALLAAVAAIAYSQRATIATRLMAKGLESRMGADIVAELEDGLHLALCGAGGPMPAPNASGPCVAVVAGKQLFMVDAGTDGPRNLARMGYQPGTVRGVFLTHFHSDHIDGLGEISTLRWAGGDNATPLPVYGPRGVERVVDGFNAAYAQDFTYRHEHHGDLVAPMSAAGMQAIPFDKPPMGELTLVYEGEGLKVEMLAVDHSPVEPAVGYRFSYKGRSLLITGDTTKQANIRKFSEGIDLLVHEALAPNLVNMMNATARRLGNQIMAKITYDILDYHASPVEAAETARDAGVGHLLYYHIVPPLVIPGQDLLYLNGAEDIFPNYTIGEDGVAFTLPANSKEIIKTSAGL
ncbi:MBL fold metallo-hydrolase [Seongchinamella unica]|uniref:MBL fold metallo-hydrolase n=1 Tax=Seongchinamella unica TaxID=2547392 RepID=A0A4R5LR82_9GAMM|nr:MBL fold metallo-hydrolase [Seongchinamella unica]TDG13369.1 MBL fold metallo-hydrolase [Seongchinamella unica]